MAASGQICCQRTRTLNYLSVFLSLTWLSAIVYYLLGQFVLDGSLFSKEKIPYFETSDDNPESSFNSAMERKYGPLLAELGFVKNPLLYPLSHHAPESQLPVFVIALTAQDVKGFYSFIGSLKMYYPNKKLVVYNLGIPEHDVAWIRIACHCVIRKVQWEKYPSHVKDPRLKAYIPILIQDTLQEFGVVFWCDVQMRFTNPLIQPLFDQAKQWGLVAWATQEYPTSSFTHYNMVRFFQMTHSQFYFHKMVEPTAAIFFHYNTIHDYLMRPWVQCALDLDCIAPLGSQYSGCNSSRKPKYIYAGCHRYATSAFNVLLGRMFAFKMPYLPNQTIFHVTIKEDSPSWKLWSLISS